MDAYIFRNGRVIGIKKHGTGIYHYYVSPRKTRPTLISIMKINNKIIRRIHLNNNQIIESRW